MQESRVKKLTIYITGVLDILICLLLFISAMYKGGFYKEDTLFINMIVCMLGLVCLAVKLVLNIRDSNVITKSRLGSLIDITMISVSIAYFLPILFNTKASMESALFELTRYVNLGIIYFIVRSSKNKKIYLTSIIAIAAVMAVLGIDEITYRAFEETLNTLSMGYLTETTGRIASTIQYANITALLMLVASIILQEKLVRNISKIKENNIGFSALVAVELFVLILFQTSIILTGSRMNIFLMVIASIIYTAYLCKYDKKRNAATILLITLASFILVSSIDGYLLIQNYFMVIFTYLLTLVVALVYVVLYRLLKDKEEKIEKRTHNSFSIKSKKLISICVILGIIGCVIICITPKALVVKDDTKTGINVSRNIYGEFKGEYDLKLDLTVEEGDKYSINIYEIDEEFNKNEIAYILPKDITNGTYETRLNVSSDTQRLQFVVNVTRCKVRIDKLEIGDKKVKLSYMFLPDNLVFRLKDTLTKDSNNELRLIYYKDALELFKLSPLIGHGGEGFKARYQEVQDTTYVSSETHSVPLQILVETGIIGLTIYIITVVATYTLIFKLIKAKNSSGITYLLAFSVYIITSIFDLVFSFGIMITLFGVIIGEVVNEYKEKYISGKDEYKLDNKSSLGMAKIATLSLSLMSLIVITTYSINMYRASMLIMPEETEAKVSSSYEKVGILEEKVRLDKYNVEFLTSLMSEYSNHISMLNDIYITTTVEQDREILKNESDNYIVKQKEIADKLIEYEYYNKYVLDKVARAYFDNYVTYARIYEKTFKNREIAYVFYVGYGIKLTKRLEEVGSVNKVALGLAYNIYKEYIPKLESQNNIISSEMLASAIQDMKNEFERIKEKAGN